MKRIKILLFLFVFHFINGQITIKITAIPTNTPTNATIYMAGDVNSWNEADPNYIMQNDGLGNKQITIPEGIGSINYKFTRGSWASVEGNASGSFRPNRTFTFTGKPQTINLTILSWEDLGGTSTNSTAAANVQVLNTAFFMPQLNKSRKIWLYLPPDYNTTTKRYPVLYMADGQNLFDNKTSFSGEWQVDETLNSLFNQGDYGAIVVGIDNGASDRLNEYSPWVNTQYNAGGKGNAYMQFVAETLKPYIDSNFRTQPEPEFNALLGSSMGALISVYGACKFSSKFEKIGVFSPAFWFSLSDLNTYISTNTNSIDNLRLYFVAGQNESTTMVSNINTIKNNLISKGVSNSEVFTKFDSYGTHTESYWKGEFGAAYKWLFSKTNLSTKEISNQSNFEIQQLTNGEIWINGLPNETSFGLYSILGKKITTVKFAKGINILPENLARGIYFLKSVVMQNPKAIKILIR